VDTSLDKSTVPAFPLPLQCDVDEILCDVHEPLSARKLKHFFVAVLYLESMILASTDDWNLQTSTGFNFKSVAFFSHRDQRKPTQAAGDC